MNLTNALMEARDKINRSYMTDEWALAEEIREGDIVESTLHERGFVPIYCFDGEIIFSYQMAAMLQYRATEMWVVYFAGGRSPKPTGTILRIRRVNPGDF